MTIRPDMAAFRSARVLPLLVVLSHAAAGCGNASTGSGDAGGSDADLGTSSRSDLGATSSDMDPTTSSDLDSNVPSSDLGLIPTPDLATPPPSGAVKAAATCEYAAVKTAYDSAADGDGVSIPAGTCTWNQALTVSKGVFITGAGIGTTNLAGARFNVTVPHGRAWRVGGFTATGTAGFNITGTSKSGRVDHIRFQSVTGFTANRIVWIEPSACYSAGVIDHVVFNDPKSIQVHVRETGCAGGNGSYMRALDLGGPDAWYIEDSTFEQLSASYNVSTPATDCEGGGRIVVRHSTVKVQYIEMHDAIIGGLRSCRKWEFYDNTFSPDSVKNYGALGIRGGTGVVFNNTFTASTDAATEIFLDLYRTYQTGGSPWNALCSTSTGKTVTYSPYFYPHPLAQ